MIFSMHKQNQQIAFHQDNNSSATIMCTLLVITLINLGTIYEQLALNGQATV
jgi:hypothetical protein